MQVPRYLSFLLLAASLSVPAARAQFPNFPAADKVLGSPDFTTLGTSPSTPSSVFLPKGLAIDPVTGKLFVCSSNQNRILRFANPGSLANGANAEAVIGQVNFSGGSTGSTATTFNLPSDIYVDRLGRLWVADTDNNRVLMFMGAGTLSGFGSTADRVLGQPNFTTVTAGLSNAKMDAPTGVFVDANDNLWVAEAGNHRVLKFDGASSLSNGATATTVLGQPNFTTNSTGTSSVKMNSPRGLIVDEAGRLWVTDFENSRVLRFDAAATLANGAAASGVLGQSSFVGAGGGVSAQALDHPTGVMIDGYGSLYIADFFNFRVLIHKNPASKADGAAADTVIGQPDFDTKTQATTARNLAGAFTGMASDSAGGLWVSDSLNSRVLHYSPDRSASAPVVQGKVPKTTSKGSLALKGTASDGSGVGSVRYRVNGGAFKNAAGTTSWKFTAKLTNGTNTIEIVTVDTLGNTSPAKRLKVTRK